MPADTLDYRKDLEHKRYDQEKNKQVILQLYHTRNVNVAFFMRAGVGGGGGGH